MEASDDVLVVIQAESGEEIALPLAALGEQHQEVIVDGSACTSRDELKNQSETTTLTNDGLELGPEVEQIEKREPVKVNRPKQKRKQPLVYLPFSDDDVKIEFQLIDEQPSQPSEEPKKRPRREYRTRKKLAALEAASNDDNKTVSNTPTPDADECQNIKVEVPQETPCPPKIKPQNDSKQDHENRIEHASPRRTRLSNACRIATSKLYKCPECDFTTERINNIIMHMKESCNKGGKTNKV